jgi:glycosyltransferase involved in cell wall biosynthesis
MKIGVALPARNVAPYIETCITSINAQTHPCAAYIVDDASDDGTYEFLAERPTWWRRLARNSEQAGWPWSLNYAAAMAIADGCDAVFVMNADDWLRLDCIEQCARLLQRCDAVVPYTQQIGGENVVQASAGHVTPESFTDHTPLVAFCLVRADVWKALGGYHTDVNLPGLMAGYNEWDFWIRFHLAGNLHNVVTEPVVYYRMHDEQLHRDTTAQHETAVALLRAKHPDLPWDGQPEEQDTQ